MSSPPLSIFISLFLLSYAIAKGKEGGRVKASTISIPFFFFLSYEEKRGERVF